MLAYRVTLALTALQCTCTEEKAKRASLDVKTPSSVYKMPSSGKLGVESRPVCMGDSQVHNHGKDAADRG